jgi:GNAT superfamily N-acetyltransferase
MNRDAGQGATEVDAARAAALLTALPDIPAWLYARSLLRSGQAAVRGTLDAGAALVLDHEVAVLVGRPDRELIRETLAGSQPGPVLLVHGDVLADACSALPNWSVRPFIVHALPGPFQEHGPLATGVLVSDPLDPVVLTGLPDDIYADAAQAPAAAVRLVGGAPVAVCFVADLSEGLWDVGIDTVPEAWRQGHGTAVFLALATAMAEHGRQPVWAAYEDYPPSLAMAARLGFRPVARMAELTPPAPA